MSYINQLSLKFSALSENESFARLAVASFCSSKIKDLEGISDIKTAVSEAVTNSIVHAYEDSVGEIEINCKLFDTHIEIEVIDCGVGIPDISMARKPFYSSKPDMERSGMGFAVMEGFMDKVLIQSELNKGTKITLIKEIKKSA